MSLPASHDIAIYQGDTIVLKLQYHDAKGNPLDLTGASVRLAGKVNITDKDPTLLLDGQVYNAHLGKFAFSLDVAASTQLPPKLVYDIQLTLANKFVRTILHGNLETVREVY